MAEHDLRGASASNATTVASEMVGTTSPGKGILDLGGELENSKGGHAFGGGGRVIHDVGPKLIAACSEIHVGTPNSTITSHAATIESELRNAGIKRVGWVGEMLFQCRGVEEGVGGDLTKFKANVSIGQSVGAIGPNGARQLLARVGSGGATVTAALGGAVNAPKTSIADAQHAVDRAMHGRDVDAAEAALQAAGFKRPAIINAMTLVRHVLTPAGGDLRGWLERLGHLLAVARDQGTLSMAAVRDWTAYIGTLTDRHLVVSDADRATTREKYAPMYQAAAADLGRAKNLRAWVDKKQGWTSTGNGDGYIVKLAIGNLENTGGVLGGAAHVLEVALNLPDSNLSKNERVQAASKRLHSLLAQIAPAGVDVAQHLDAKREAGYDMLGRAAGVASMVPVIGKPLAVSLRGIEAGTRYLSGDWTAAEAVAKFTVSTVETALGSKIPGKGTPAARAVRTFFAKAAAGLITELTAAYADQSVTGDARAHRISAAIAHALTKAFIEAIGAAIAGNIEVGTDDESRREVYKLFYDIAKKCGVDQYLTTPLANLKKAWKLDHAN